MRINTKVRYGLRAMIEIASVNDTNGILLKEISKNQNISNKYLDPIISSLKLKGLISNTKGKHSGYRLTRKPEEITMLDIYTAFEPITVVGCINNNTFCENSCNCLGKNYWEVFKKDFEEMLMKKNLAQIINNTLN